MNIQKGDNIKVVNGYGDSQISQVDEVFDDGSLYAEGDPESGTYSIDDVELDELTVLMREVGYQ